MLPLLIFDRRMLSLEMLMVHTHLLLRMVRTLERYNITRTCLKLQIKTLGCKEMVAFMFHLLSKVLLIGLINNSMMRQVSRPRARSIGLLLQLLLSQVVLCTNSSVRSKRFHMGNGSTLLMRLILQLLWDQARMSQMDDQIDTVSLLPKAIRLVLGSLLRHSQ